MDALARVARFGGEQVFDDRMCVFLFRGDADTAFPGPLGDDREPRHQCFCILRRQQSHLGQHARMSSAARGIVGQEDRIQVRIFAYGEAVHRRIQRQALGPELCAHAAQSLDFASRDTTMVPLPWLVNTSVNTASGSTPLTRCALATPPVRARRTAASLGRMPPLTLPDLSMPSRPSRVV